MAQESRELTSGQAASRLAGQVRTENEDTQFDVEKLFIITQALWEILKQQNGYTDEQLEEMITEIDLRDGKLDGKIAKSTERRECGECGRAIMRRQMKCLYCGAPAPQDSFRR